MGNPIEIDDLGVPCFRKPPYRTFTCSLLSKDCSQLETVERVGYRRKSNETGAGFECDLTSAVLVCV